MATFVLTPKELEDKSKLQKILGKASICTSVNEKGWQISKTKHEWEHKKGVQMPTLKTNQIIVYVKIEMPE